MIFYNKREFCKEGCFWLKKANTNPFWGSECERLKIQSIVEKGGFFERVFGWVRLERLELVPI
jgi:hypothetical protein